MILADPALVRRIEETSLNALPTLATQVVDGWVARFAEGVTSRANSVNALHSDPAPAIEVAPTVEALYARRGLPCRFRVTPLCPDGTPAALEARGCAHTETVATEIATISADWRVDPEIAFAEASDDAWRLAYSEAAGRFDARERAVLGRMHDAILPAKTFARLEIGGRVAATGFAVAERGLVSLHEITTAPAFRRRGLAHRMVTSLMAWGRQQGATQAWLQVSATNDPARALYRTLGFREAYTYGYWVRD